MTDTLYDSKTDLLLAHMHELTKTYIAFDGFNRMVTVYTAHTEAAHGANCIKTQYEYDGATTRIKKRKESKTTWDAAWDI